MTSLVDKELVKKLEADIDRLTRERDSWRALQKSAMEQWHKTIGERDRLTSALREATSREATLRAALERSGCPYPIGDDDGTVKDCVSKGHCACENREALAPQPTITKGESLPLEITEYSPLDEEEE